MTITFGPTPLDVEVAAALARRMGHRLFDLSVQSGIRHDILGGWIFAAVLAVIWITAVHDRDERARRQVLTILLGVLLAGLFSELATHLLSWPPPRHLPQLRSLYPPYLDDLAVANSFPSQSTAIYAPVVVGLWAIRRKLGALLAGALIFLIALPRMYLGGHYVSDVAAGIAIGSLGYFAIRGLARRGTTAALDSFGMRTPRSRRWYFFILFTVFWQLAVEFRELVWVKSSLHYFLGS